MSPLVLTVRTNVRAFSLPTISPYSGWKVHIYLPPLLLQEAFFV